jgi:hypothetical protein
MFRCSCTIFRECITRAILTTVNLASMNNAFPEDGATALKHVRAILM